MDKKKILIIEDDQDMRRALNIRLRASNYDTCFAADGLAAISTAKKELPDMILLDIGLPAGDGFTVLQRLQNLAATATIPVIVLSARDPQTNKQRALDAGALGYLQKPVDNAELLLTIQDVLVC
jgi:DNA-binding response OmpR family regulator